MKEQPNYNSFQELLKNNSHSTPQSTENFDAVVPADPAPRQNNNPPQIPQWGHSLTGRVTKLEKNMTWVKQNMATKQDLTAITQRLDAQQASLDAQQASLDAQQKSLKAIADHLKGK